MTTMNTFTTLTPFSPYSVKSSTEPGKHFQETGSENSDAEDTNTSQTTAHTSSNDSRGFIFSRKELQSALSSLKVAQAKVKPPSNLLALRSRTVTAYSKYQNYRKPVTLVFNWDDEQPDFSKKFREDVKIDDNEAIRRKLRMVLNALAEDNYEKLKFEILDLASRNIEVCKMALDFIVIHAWEQSKYRNLYSRLCKFLTQSEKMPKIGEKKLFWKMLVTKLQGVFEGIGRDYKLIDPQNLIEARENDHRRDLENISFIGELYNEGVIKKNMIREITFSILSEFLDHYSRHVPTQDKPKFIIHEDVLEIFVTFYETIGEKFENDSKSDVAKSESEKLVSTFAAILDGKDINFSTVTKANFSVTHVIQMFQIILDKIKLTPRLNSLTQNLISRRDERLGFVKPSITKPSETNKPKIIEKEATKNEESKTSEPVKLNTQAIPDKKGIEEEEIVPKTVSKFKQLYKIYVDSTSDTLAELIADQFSTEPNKGLLISIGFLMTFYDARETVLMNSRIPLFKSLVEKKLICLDDFKVGLMESLKTLDVEENPMAPSYFAKLILVYLEITNAKLGLNDLLSGVKRAEEEDDMFVEFKSDLLEKLGKLAEEKSICLD